MTDSPDVPDRLKQALADRYDLIRELGAGGMATVYLADDLKHNRKVAVKVLRPELAAVVGAERFLTEIETTANLQHPHILPLHDSGEADTFLFYVMPYVDGETLRERLDREHQLPVDEAVRMATDMGEALDYAHRAGVVHRDIKPANVLVHEGRPLIADFGIALAVGAAGGTRLTETGLSVGTPFYMSPEQATGQAIGAASDTYSLACVLYEMLVGEPPYPGATPQAVLGKIIAGDPVSATKMRQSIPINVDAAIQKALEKLPADRFKSTQDFIQALGDPAFRHGAAAAGIAAGGGSGPWKRNALLGWGVAAIALMGLAWSASRPAPEQPVARYSVILPDGDGLKAVGQPRVALSPTSHRLVYVGEPSEPGPFSQLWVRAQDQLTAMPLPGTAANTVSPTFSPRGDRVAYLTAGPSTLWVVSLSGGPPVTVADSGIALGGAAWGTDGNIYVWGGSPGPDGIVRVPEGGGAPESVTVPDTAAGETGHRWMDALPNGKGLIFTAQRSAAEEDDIAAVDLETGQHHIVTRGVYARFAPSGHLVYVTADGTLMAAPFDQDRLEITGDAVALVEGIRVAANGSVDLAISANGTLMYTTGSAASASQAELVWVTRQGADTPVDPGWVFDVGDANRGWTLSPDNTKIALRAQTEAGSDIWIKELPQGPLSRLTFDEGIDRMAMWTPDGESVSFLSNRGDNLDVWMKRADGTGEAQLIHDNERTLAEHLWSPDREWLVVRTGGTGGVLGGRDVLALRPESDTVLTPLLDATFDESAITLSPDGRWLAYQSNETGSDEIFVRPFPDVDSGKWQVSTEGGLSPLWGHSGRELFYISPGEEMMVAQIETSPAFRVGERSTLFQIESQYILGDRTTQYDVTLDDETFLMARLYGQEDAPNELIVVENWFEELEERVGN